MKIYDFQGEQRDADWLAANYGNVQVVTCADDEFEVVEIHERVNTAAILACTALDEHGEPIPGFEMAFYWPNAPETPGCGGYGRAVRATTKDEGEASVPIGTGAYYDPAAKAGPHAWWPWGQTGPIIDGLGMIAGTNHDHLNIVLKKRSGEDPPEEPPAEECLLDVHVIGHGTVQATPEPTAGGLLPAGAIVELLAMPDEGHAFDGWLGDLDGDDNPVNFQMDGPKETVAVFVPEEPAEIPVEQIGALILDAQQKMAEALALLGQDEALALLAVGRGQRWNLEPAQNLAMETEAQFAAQGQEPRAEDRD